MKKKILHRIQGVSLVVAAVLVWLPWEPTIMKVAATVIVGVNALVDFFR